MGKRCRCSMDGAYMHVLGNETNNLIKEKAVKILVSANGLFIQRYRSVK